MNNNRFSTELFGFEQLSVFYAPTLETINALFGDNAFSLLERAILYKDIKLPISVDRDSLLGDIIFFRTSEPIFTYEALSDFSSEEDIYDDEELSRVLLVEGVCDLQELLSIKKYRLSPSVAHHKNIYEIVEYLKSTMVSCKRNIEGHLYLP